MKWLINFSLALAAILICILLAEIGLRIFDRFFLLTADNCYEASPIPELPHIAKANFKKRGYSTNSRHLRDSEIPLQKPPENLRVAVVGNSMTIGHGVEQDNLYTEIMERDLKARFRGSLGIDVINAAQQGYNIAHFMPFARQFVYAYQPDYLIYQFCWNDIEASSLMRFRNLPDMVPSRGLSRYVARYSRLFGNMMRLRDLGEFAQNIMICYQDSLAWRGFITDLTAWADDVRSRNIRFAVAIFPHVLEVQIPERYPELAEEFRRQRNRILEECHREGIPTCDLTDPFVENFRKNHQDLYSDFWHFNPRGHALAASILEAWLIPELKAASLLPNQTTP